jgi:K+ transporter
MKRLGTTFGPVLVLWFSEMMNNKARWIGGMAQAIL